jgi:hypothetical protein
MSQDEAMEKPTLTTNQKNAALGVAGALVVFALGFSLGRQGGVQDRTSTDKSAEVTATAEKPKPIKTTKPIEQGPRSHIRESVDPLTDEIKYTFALYSTNEMRNSVGMADTDNLILRCQGNKTDLYVDTSAFVSSDGQSVKVRWNDGAVSSQWWSGASGGGALFSGAPITMLNQMVTADKFVISYSPYSKATTSAVFDFTNKGTRADIKKMQEVCK